MKLKKGDYFLVVNDMYNPILNGMIGIYTGTPKLKIYDNWKHSGIIIINKDRWKEYKIEYQFHLDEVKKLTKEEVMIEML